MAMTDFVRRSVQIVAGGIAQSTTDYFDNATTFVNDVKEVIDMGRQIGSSGVKKFNELKSSGIIKKTRDWFYNEGGMFGDFDFDDDDFDAGFEIDSADSESSSDSSKPLSKDMMSDIAKKQTGAMYKAFGRQADLHIANTAEIISTINTRTAELTASVNNVNNTLIQIGKRLDLIVEWTAGRAKKEEEEIRKASILDYGGGISLSGVVNKAKENAEDSMLGTFMSIGKTMLGSGMMTPETVMSMILSQTILDKKWDKLGGKSVNDIGEFINDTVGEIVQNTMTRILTSKNEILETLFEDIISKAGGKNYQSSVKNTYNDKPAVFDGMTRKSIITVIPGYLNEILKAVNNGKGMQVDSKGNLTHKKSDSFVKQVADSYFRSGTMEYKQRELAAAHTGLTSQEVTNAVRTLTGCWMWEIYASGRVILEIGEVKNIRYKSTKRVVENAAKMMTSADSKKRSVGEWILLYQGIIEEIDEFKYRQELQRSAERADKDLESFAKTHVNNHQARAVSHNVLMEAFRQNFSEFNSDAKFHEPGKGSSVNPTQIGSTNSPTTITTFDYVAGIFNQLNRGMNVFITGQNRSQKTPYEPIKMKPGYGKDANNLVTSPVANVSETVSNAVDPIVNTANTLVMAATGGKGKEYDDAPDEIKEILDTPEDQRTPAQIKTLKKYRSGKTKNFGKSVVGWAKNKLDQYSEDSRKMGIVADPESYQMISDMMDNIKKAVSDIVPQKLKDAFKDVKESDTYQNIANSEKAGKVKEGLVSAKNKAGDLLMGKASTNDEGEIVRTGGVLHAVAKPLSGIGTGISNLALKATPTSILQSRTEKLMGEYSPDKTFDKDNSDALHMQVISSIVNVAISNGDISTIDEQTVNKEIAAVKDPDLKRRLKQSVVPLMKRNSKSADKSGDGSSKDKPTSTLGKLFGLVKMAASFIIKPITTLFKGIAGSIIGVIKYIGGTIIKLAKKGITRGINQIKYGAKSLASGMGDVFGSLTSGISKRINKLYDGIMDRKEKSDKKKEERANAKAEKRANKQAQTRDVSDGADGKEKVSLKDRIKSIPGKISDTKTSWINKLTKNENGFAAGFFKARNDRKEAEAKAKLKEQTTPITTAMNEAGITEIKTASEEVAEVLKDESDAGKGFMKPILKMLKELISKDKDSEGSLTDESGTGENSVDESKTKTENETGQTETGTNKTKTKTNKTEQTSESQTKKQKDAPVKTGDASGGGDGKQGGGLKNSLGKMLGGITSMLGGIWNIVLSAVLSLEGVKMATDLVMNILSESLEPLNGAIQAIVKVLKPFIKQIGSLVKQLVGFIVDIAEIVCDIIQPIMKDVIQPILEVISPLLQTIIGCLTPLLKIIGIILKVVLAPLMGLFKFVLLPILKIIGDAVQIIMGVLQIGFGLIMGAIGTVISVLGAIISAIPGAGGKGKGILESGTSMAKQGADFVAQGVKSVAQGAVNLALDYASLYTMGATDTLLDRNQEGEEKKETKKIEAPDNTNAVESTYANGDITTIYNTYGGEYQRGMGGYLNMDQRGCGPIALADMYNRNSSGRLSARSLAGSMYRSGAYDPHRGTSVADYIDTANSMGMNVRAGRVTQQSLKSASPSNPITVVGSGSDYGTRRGNNHFMNVIGTDSHGGAYVSNPLTGRIDRRPASTVAGSALMGIYGSGDEADGGYTFPDAIREAFAKLKEEANKILGLFSMEKSEEEETEELINAEQNKAATEQAKRQLEKNDPDLYAKYEAQAKIDARKAYEEKYPQKDNQSDEEYEKGFEDFWNKNSAQYLGRAVVEDVAFSDAAKKDFDEKSGYADIATKSQSFVDEITSSFEGVTSSASTAESSFGSSGGSGNVSDIYEAASQVWEGYVKKVPSGEYLHSDKGPITTRSGVIIPEIHPDCSGMLSATMNYMGYDFKGTMNGSTRRWTTHDISGKTSNNLIYKDGQLSSDWEFIPYSDGELKEGDIITTPEHVGLYVQGQNSNAYGFDAGDTTGKRTQTIGNGLAKAYLDKDPNWRDQLQWTMGPGYSGLTTILRYVGGNKAKEGRIDLTGGTLADHSAWSYYSGRAGVPTFINAGKVAGMSPAEIATLMSTGIWEDGGEKIFGLKSLNATTYDYNGQAAKGIMNWVDQNVNYGDTVTDQLKYIHNTYFDANSNDYRAKVRDTGYGTQDLQAFKTATGRNGFKLKIDDRYGPYTNEDLVEGSAFFFMDALVPEKIHTAKGMAENVGTAAEAYNWMIDNGYVDIDDPISPTGQGSVSTGFGMVNSAWDAQVLSNINQIGTSSGKNTGTVITNDTGLALKAKPSLDSEFLIEIPKGTFLNLETSGSKDWFKTSYAGKTGYVYAHYISLDRNETTDKYAAAANESKQTANKNNSNDAVMKELQEYANKATGGSTTTSNVNHDGDAQWYKTDSGVWKFDDQVFASNDPRWRSAWYNESSPVHYNEAPEAYDSLSHMVMLGTSPNMRDGKYYNNLLKGYGGDMVAKDAVEDLHDEMMTADDWKNARDEYITTGKRNRVNTLFVDDLWNLHNAFWPNNKLSRSEMETRVKGSGDMSELDFWDGYLGWNNKYANSNVTTPIGEDIVDATSDAYYDEATGATVVNNNYTVTRGEDSATEERLRAILANTYNVRSESMEALLRAILEELRKRKDPRGGGNNTNGSTKLFNERIPSQVTKLSIG